MRAIIIDDEVAGINTLKVLIKRLRPEMDIIAVASDEMEGIRFVDQLKPDVVFLDIMMPVMDGFELLDRLHFKDFKLVFTTAHREYALNAIKSKAFDYLLKPIDPDDLKVCLDRIFSSPVSKTDSRSKSLIELPVSDGIILIRQQNIVRLEASGSYCELHLKDGTKHLASKNLKYFEALLDPAIFYRVHNSHIINLNEVSKIINSDGLFVQLSDGSTAELSRKNKEILLAKLKQL